MGITFYSLGGAQEVTGSKHVLEINGVPLLVDCGAFQGTRAEADRKNREFAIPAEKLSAVVLTHAHYDHCGLLPLLVKKGFRQNIFATSATRDLANLIMMDSARIQKRDAEYLAKQAKKRGESFNWRPLFDESDVVKTMNQFVSISYNRKLFAAPNVEIEFFDAGHILGSALTNVKITGGENGDVNVLFSGDLGRQGKPIIRNPDTELPPPDYIVLESTYGNRLHDHADAVLDELAFIVHRCVEKQGKIIIPAFAVERTQELIYYFNLLTLQHKIPQIPIYVDSPMATNATTIFQIHPECYDDETKDTFLNQSKNPFGFGSLNFVMNVEESKALNKKPGPMIIISADGMCEFGRVVHHLANGIENPDNTVMIVGYMAENTLGRRLINRESEVKIMGEWKKVKAAVEIMTAFSAHADYAETLAWLKALDTGRLKRIFLVHGENEAQENLQHILMQNFFHDVEIVRYGATYNLQ